MPLNQFIKENKPPLLVLALSGILTACGGDNDSNDEQIDQLQTKINTLQNELSITTETDALRQDIESMTAQIESLSTENTTQQAAYDQQLQDIENILSVADNRLNALALSESLQALEIIHKAERFADLRL